MLTGPSQGCGTPTKKQDRLQQAKEPVMPWAWLFFLIL